MSARYVAGTVGILGAGAGLLGAYEYSTVAEYTNKEAAAKRFLKLATDMRAGLQSRYDMAEKAVVERGNEREQLLSALSAAEKAAAAAEAARDKAQKDREQKALRLKEVETQIANARADAGSLVKEIVEKAKNIDEAKAAADKATAAANKARRRSWLSKVVNI